MHKSGDKNKSKNDHKNENKNKAIRMKDKNKITIKK